MVGSHPPDAGFAETLQLVSLDGCREAVSGVAGVENEMYIKLSIMNVDISGRCSPSH